MRSRTDESGPGARFRACAALFACCLGGLRATDVAACERRSDAEEDERESETRADSSVLPVEAGRDDLRLADRPRLRADELDLVARGGVRQCAHDLDLISPGEGGVARGRAGLLDSDELDLISARERGGARRQARLLDSDESIWLLDVLTATTGSP